MEGTNQTTTEITLSENEVSTNDSSFKDSSFMDIEKYRLAVGDSKYKPLTSDKTIKTSEITVSKWADYSDKYGLGYLLSNGATGVFFNDSTKIILNPKDSSFTYMEEEMIESFTLSDYPKELEKKVIVSGHFKKYLEGDIKFDLGEDLSTKEEVDETTPVHLKKWIMTKHAIMFRLSNKIVQVIFTDDTEIIANSINEVITYINKKGEQSNYPMNTAFECSDTEMTKRLKYFEPILREMMNKKETEGAMKLQGD